MVKTGVFNGGSLRMWRDYFGHQARIFGVGASPGCAAFAEPGIEIKIGDQSDRAFLSGLAERYPLPAIVPDDGGHHMHQQVASFVELYPRMHPEGVYACEDTHTSYFAHFGGGAGRVGTFVEAAKALVDRTALAGRSAGAGRRIRARDRFDPLLRPHGRVRAPPARAAAGPPLRQERAPALRRALGVRAAVGRGDGSRLRRRRGSRLRPQ